MPTHFFRLTTSMFAVACLCLAAPARAADYDEAVSGDLSGTPATPTPWALQAGANKLTGAAGTPRDYDLVAFTVPAGHQLNSLVLDAHVLQNSTLSFLGLQPGSVWTTGLGGLVDGETLIGWELFDSSSVGRNLLPVMGQNAEGFNPGKGVVPPLAAGTYAMLLQDTGGVFTYEFTLTVTAVPEPATAMLSIATTLALAYLGRRCRT